MARANILAIEEDEAPSGTDNIGTGAETSVNELYEKLREASCKDLPPAYTAPPNRGNSCAAA